MTKTMKQKTQIQTPFHNLEAAARWAVEAVDDGRLDHGELYDLLKDFLDGKDMKHWLDEDAERQEIASSISQS